MTSVVPSCVYFMLRSTRWKKYTEGIHFLDESIKNKTGCEAKNKPVSRFTATLVFHSKYVSVPNLIQVMSDLFQI